ncbi:hypothetical protein [Microbulbifer sp. JMSA003]|uniref:hypothetical protein n=1 Tax=Microbulbifer sp. JMSA003 TaxID=3243369 RepID=UPI00403A504F
MSKERELIVAKGGQAKNPDMGSLKIVFVISENNSVDQPDQSEFPTAGIWISKGYQELEARFKEGELFRLTRWNLQDSDRLSATPVGVLQKHRHWAFGSSVKTIDNSEFLPIFRCPPPDKNTGLMEETVATHNKPFFVNHNGFVYGPFTIAAYEEDKGLKVAPYQQSLFSLKNQYVFKVEYSALDNARSVAKALGSDGLGSYEYLISFKRLNELSENSLEQEDFISDEQLISYFSKAKIGKKNGILSRREAEKLKAGIADLLKKNQIQSNKERTKRLSELLDRYLSDSDVGEEIVSDFLTSSIGKSFLKGYVDKNPALLDRFLGEAKKKATEEKERLDTEIAELEDKIETLRDQASAQKTRVEEEKRKATEEIEEVRVVSKAQIEKIRAQSKEELEEERKIRSGQLETELSNAQEKLADVKVDLEEKYKEINDVKSYQEIKQKIDYLKQHEYETKKAVETQQQLLNSTSLGEKATEVKTIIDILRGRSIDGADEEKYSFTPPKMAATVPVNGEEYIQTLVDLLDDDSHTLSFAELSNLLICIQQSFLTVLSGPPGSGKTSSILKIAEHSGLRAGTEDCFLNVPVSRGWVSSRDFIGFNNSLKGVYQPAKTGLYQFLRRGEDEEANSYLRLILLDEANLSSIEHYWSEFLSLCDKEGRSRPIDTGIVGDKRLLRVPDGVRFTATINNDSTTEALSPRLCDRVPVISMAAPHFSNIQQVASGTLDGVVSYAQLEKWFNRDDFEEAPSLINDFIERMERLDREFGGAVRISPRKRNAISKYYSVASGYLGHLGAVDFAISQYLLPLISGHGKPFSRRLESLLELSVRNELKRSESIIDNILKSGEMYVDSYSFF